MNLAQPTANQVQQSSSSTTGERTAPIKIAFVIDSMGVGGAERSIARLANALNRELYQPIVICMQKSGPAIDWIKRPIPVIELNKRPRILDRMAVQNFARELLEHQIDIVHSHNWGTMLESSLAARQSSAKHVHAERGTVLGKVENGGLKIKLRGLVAAVALRRCAAVISNSNAVAQRIQKRCHFSSEKVQIIPNGIEKIPVVRCTNQLNELRQQLGILPSDNVLGSVGRLCSVKGFEVAIAAIAKLDRSFHFVLVGDGGEKEKLMETADRFNVTDRVHFVGHREDIGTWLGLFDAYINSSHSEGMSQSIIEAMSAGLPIIATDVGDSAHLVGQHSECGKIVVPNDPQQMATAIASVFKNSAQQKAFGHAAYLRQAELFSVAKMVQRYEALYRSVLCR